MSQPDLFAPEIYAKVREFMATGIPFNAVLGIVLEQLTKGHAVLRIPFRDELIGDPFRPAIHGGVISALIDTAGGAAMFSVVNLSDRCSTVDFRVDFLRPAGKADLIATADVLRIGNRMGVTRVTVVGCDPPVVVAEGMCVYNVRRESQRK